MRKAWRWTKRAGLAVLFVAAAMCLASEFRFPVVAVYRTQGPHYLFCLAQQTLLVERTPGRVAIATGVADSGWTISSNITSPATVGGLRCWWPRLGDFTVTMRIGTSLSIPLWPVHIIALLGLVAWIRSMRLQPGQCPSCRYDLRGLPKDAAVCPECGARITGKKA
jgi:hypothetical protein